MTTTTQQLQTMLDLHADGVVWDQAQVHPYSGCLTLSHERTTLAIIEPSGVVTWRAA